jgi:hypothetical protein
LPRPVIIPEVMELGTLADVRALIEKYRPNIARSSPGDTSPECCGARQRARRM